MTEVEIQVTGAFAKAKVSGKITAGMTGCKVHVKLDKQWKGLSPMLVAKSDGVAMPMVINPDGWSEIPHERCVGGARLLVGIDGRSQNGAVRIPTVWADCGIVAQSPAEEALAQTTPPTPSIAEQIIAQTEKAFQAVDSASRMVEQAKRDIDASKQSIQNSITAAGMVQVERVQREGATAADSAKEQADRAEWARDAAINALSTLEPVHIEEDDEDVVVGGMVIHDGGSVDAEIIRTIVDYYGYADKDYVDHAINNEVSHVYAWADMNFAPIGSIADGGMTEDGVRDIVEGYDYADKDYVSQQIADGNFAGKPYVDNAIQRVSQSITDGDFTSKTYVDKAISDSDKAVRNWASQTFAPIGSSSGGGTAAVGSSSNGAFYPETYGAKGDGSTDDSAAIQAAINAAGTQGLVILSAQKVYAIRTPIKLSKGYQQLFCYGSIEQLENKDAVQIESDYNRVYIKKLVSAGNGLTVGNGHVAQCNDVEVMYIDSEGVGILLNVIPSVPAGKATWLQYNSFRGKYILTRNSAIRLYIDAACPVYTYTWNNENRFYDFFCITQNTAVPTIDIDNECSGSVDICNGNTFRSVSVEFSKNATATCAVRIKNALAIKIEDMRTEEIESNAIKGKGTKVAILEGLCKYNRIECSLCYTNHVDISGASILQNNRIYPLRSATPQYIYVNGSSVETRSI